LRFLVTAGEQNNEHSAALNVIDAIAGPIIDTHLRDAAAYRLHITRIAYLKAVNSCLDPALRPAVTKAGKPAREYLGLADFGDGLM